MEVIFHLILTIIKISILGSVYATIILVSFGLLGKFFPESFFNKASKEKRKLWFSSGFVTSILIILYAFTYWGNHGLGDGARIPVGHWKSVCQTDGMWSYIKNIDYDAGQVSIKEYALTNSFVCARTGNSTVENYPGDYVIWNLKTNKVEFYLNENQYAEYAIRNQLPSISEFKSFNKHYKDYWGGWRFWLLA